MLQKINTEHKLHTDLPFFRHGFYSTFLRTVILIINPCHYKTIHQKINYCQNELHLRNTTHHQTFCLCCRLSLNVQINCNCTNINNQNFTYDISLHQNDMILFLKNGFCRVVFS